MNSKRKWRSQLRKKRDQLSTAERLAAARAVVDFATSDHLPADLTTIALYYPVRGEFDCGLLAQKFADQGQKTALPVVTGPSERLAFRPWQPGEALERGAYDIPVPRDKGLSIRPDLLIVPLLGFDAKGGRLGYGGGFYDRTLQFLRAGNEDFTAMGIGYDFQQLDDVPLESHDQPLDGIITPSRVMMV